MRFLTLFLIGFLVSPPAYAQSGSTADHPPLDWLSFDEALHAAGVSGRTVLVDVYSPSCGWCAKLQTQVYAKATVRNYLNEHFETARLDIANDQEVIEFKGYELKSAELASGLGAQGTPTIVFLSPAGEYITRVPGYVEVDDFMQILHYIGTGAFKTESFQDYRLRNAEVTND